MSKFQLSKEQKLELENLHLKRQNLGMQLQTINSQWSAAVTQCCQNLAQDPENIKNLDLENGVIEFSEETIEAPKAKKK